MTRVRSWFRINPIIVKELRSRMRGPRAFVTLTITLVLLGGLMYGQLQLILAMASYQSDMVSPRIGQGLFSALAFLELVMICAITPAVTAGAISGEKEKLTYEMLQSTPLSPGAVLWGKLISALSYVILLLFAGIPLASLVFIFGGVSPGEMLKTLAVLIVLAISFGVLGLFMSALFGRTGRATVASFMVVMVLTFVPLFIAIGWSVVRQSEPPRWILAPSPISLLASVMGPSNGGGAMIWDIIPILGGWWMQSAISPISQLGIPRPLYHYGFPIYGGLSLVLYLITTRLLQPARRWRMKKMELLLGVSLIVLFGATVTGVFMLTAKRYEWVRPPAVEGGGIGERTVPAIPVPMPGNGLQNLPSAVTSPSKLEVAETVQVYVAVARQLAQENTFGGNATEAPTLYLISTTSDRAGDPGTKEESPASISNEAQDQVASALADLPVKISWVVSQDDVPKDPKTGAVIGGGAVVTFGNIYNRDDGKIQVAASIYFAGLAGGGKTYVLEKIEDTWRITATTGPEWIS